VIGGPKRGPCIPTATAPDPLPFYETAVSRREFAALDRNIECDVCVVGAGYAGLSAALHLAESGHDVVLLEADRVGAGASGRNGGQVLPGYFADIDQIRRALGDERAAALWRLGTEAVALVEELAARPAIGCDFRRGHLTAAVRPRHLRALGEAARSLADRYGYRSPRLLDAVEVGALVASRRYVGGLLDERAGHLNPLRFALGLAAAAAASGARLYERSPVLAVGSRHADCWALRTPVGEVRTQRLVLTAGARSETLASALGAAVLPATTFMIATAPLGPARATALIRRGIAVADSNVVLDYYRLSADGRLLFGGGLRHAAPPPNRIAGLLRRKMLRVFPQLADVAVEHAWAGTIDITGNYLPHVGRFESSTWFAHGFAGHGVALATLTGKLLAEAIGGRSERFDLLVGAAHPWPRFLRRRALRLPLVALGAFWYRARDAVGG
jgi:gamma-glutamylputrescine oxidase